jgi:nickel-dependent lactate racemase
VSVNSYSVPVSKWFEERRLKLDFPGHWEIVPCLMRGHDTPQLTAGQIQTAFDAPAGTKPLRELAEGKQHVAIIFDDISRPTPVSTLLPFILWELREAGIPDHAIRFICATGCHSAHTYIDFVKKLGQDILDRFPVYNHNIYENCTYAGDTSQGTRLYVNAEVMACDLKIGIGSVISHPQTGFGGGGKIILPGVSAMESIEQYHSLEFTARKEGRGNTLGMGNYRDNPMFKDFTEAARIAGLDFKVDVALNGKGEACEIFCGDVEAEHALAVQYALEHYATRPVSGTDIAIVNTYCKGNEAIIGMIMGITMLAEKGGDLVLLMDCPTGQVVHYLIGSFGKNIKGRHFQAVNFTLPWIKRMIVVCPQFEHSLADWLAIPDTNWVKRWQDALKILEQDYPAAARVAVVPDGTTQYLSSK